MRCMACLAGVALWLGLSTGARASDPIGVYARIDRVVLEPGGGEPQRAQVWGTFRLALAGSRDDYQKPVQGYLYFRLPDEKADLCRREWADLKKVAGTGQCVAFGSRAKPVSGVRRRAERPKDPELYPVAAGLFKVEADSPMARSLKDASAP